MTAATARHRIGLAVRPARGALTVLGIVLGVTSLVATMGVSQTAARQILGRLDELRASQITVKPRTQAGPDRPPSLTWDTTEIAGMAGVRGVVALGAARQPGLARSVLTTAGGNAENGLSLTVTASSLGLLGAVRGTMSAGRFLNAIDERLGVRVVALGSGAAERLNIHRLQETPAVYLNGTAFTVIGILGGVERDAGLLNAAIVTATRAQVDFGVRESDRVVLDVAPDAIGQVAPKAVLALNPRHPNDLVTRLPPERPGLHRAVADDVGGLLLGLGILALIVGGIGIANVMLVNVMERVFEIGLRRALGATRRAIATQVLLEATMLGSVGGVLGSSLGVLLTVGMAAWRGWIPALDLSVPLAAPLLGALVGLVAGSYPAWRAARLEPVSALRLG